MKSIRTELNQTEMNILDYIRTQLNTTGMSPRIREISKALNFSSTATVQNALINLENAGYIVREARFPRNITLTSSSNFKPLDITPVDMDNNIYTEIPRVFVGKDTAGYNALAVPADMKTSNETTCFQVGDNEMSAEGIFKGDYIIVDPSLFLYDNSLVALVINDTVAVRRYKNKMLYDCNEENTPISIKNETVLGLITGVFRKYDYR